MPKRSSIENKSSPRLDRMAARIVKSIADLDIGNKNPAAVALGRLGGLRGGKARAAKLTPEERREIAHHAALARWNKDQGRS